MIPAGMTKYEVRFYYGTDLRTTQTVAAYDELKALAAALQAEEINEWIVERAMRVEIRIAP